VQPAAAVKQGRDVLALRLARLRRREGRVQRVGCALPAFTLQDLDGAVGNVGPGDHRLEVRAGQVCGRSRHFFFGQLVETPQFRRERHLGGGVGGRAVDAGGVGGVVGVTGLADGHGVAVLDQPVLAAVNLPVPVGYKKLRRNHGHTLANLGPML
jgi:hypothetical protein